MLRVSLSFLSTGLKNLALRRPATQTDISSGGSPERAVDGNTDQDYKSKSCSHTKSTDAIWEVDLGQMCLIDHVIIYNRGDCCGKF